MIGSLAAVISSVSRIGAEVKEDTPTACTTPGRPTSGSAPELIPTDVVGVDRRPRCDRPDAGNVQTGAGDARSGNAAVSSVRPVIPSFW